MGNTVHDIHMHQNFTKGDPNAKPAAPDSDSMEKRDNRKYVDSSNTGITLSS